MPQSDTDHRFLMCVRNEAYPASLEVRKFYRELPDSAASSRGFVRVVDESGEDYLFPSECFVVVKLPHAAVGRFFDVSEEDGRQRAIHAVGLRNAIGRMGENS